MSINKGHDVLFPNLGIELENLGKSISIFGFDIAFYGIIIALGVAAGYGIAHLQAKRSEQDTELYLDFALWAIIVSVLGARLYYVIFAWDEFRDNPLNILNLRTGGLAIYGGVIAGFLCALIFSKVRKINFKLFIDTCTPALLIGQAIGRWGNFFNREAFGEYYDGLFSMMLDVRDVHSDYRKPVEMLMAKFANNPRAFEKIMEIRENAVLIDGATYIKVHPTFLYESLWNFALLIIMLVYSKHKKFDGEIALIYFTGYGLGRFWIEGLRTDQLFLWGSSVAASQLLSGLLVVTGMAIIIYNHMKLKKSPHRVKSKNRANSRKKR
ncbi:MAG: prolipoprotein diacylglyceryl transferase [Clostridiales bacterium]|nr:prolipoprotein diacylglyceryl transferase [Clostridiales bacterium]